MLRLCCVEVFMQKKLWEIRYASSNWIKWFWVQCSSILHNADLIFPHMQSSWFQIGCSYISKSERMQVQIQSTFGLQRKLFMPPSWSTQIISVQINIHLLGHSLPELCICLFFVWLCLYVLFLPVTFLDWRCFKCRIDFVVYHKFLRTDTCLNIQRTDRRYGTTSTIELATELFWLLFYVRHANLHFVVTGWSVDKRQRDL